MTFVVTDNCIACKYTDRVSVCPVDCFYDDENMLVIDPVECIDCCVSESECPADSIRADTEEGMLSWVAFHEKYAKVWPVITEAKEPLPTPDKLDGQSGKLDTHFSEKPANAAA